MRAARRARRSWAEWALFRDESERLARQQPRLLEGCCLTLLGSSDSGRALGARAAVRRVLARHRMCAPRPPATPSAMEVAASHTREPHAPRMEGGLYVAGDEPLAPSRTPRLERARVPKAPVADPPHSGGNEKNASS